VSKIENINALIAMGGRSKNAPERRSLNEQQVKDLQAAGFCVTHTGGTVWEISSRDAAKWSQHREKRLRHRECGADVVVTTIDIVNPDEVPHEKLQNPIADAFRKLGM
jgi:hypothetical protein